MKHTVLITGAEGALGQFVARRFLNAGSEVVGTHHERSQPTGVPIRWIAMDASHADDVRSGLARAGAIDAFVHCIGGFRYGTIEKTSDEDFEFLFDANLRSTFFLLRELIPSMKRRGHGRIVLVSSKATLSPSAGMGAYCAAKAGVNAIVAAAAEELKGSNVNINAVMPSTIDTPANRRDMPEADFSKWVSPEKLADIIFSLTQPFGDPIHGALIPVAGRV